jgi:UrcA family protein
MNRNLITKMAFHCTVNAIILGSSILLGSLSAIATAAVERNDGVATRRVNFADLDLTRNEGAATLYSRIKSAARQVCDPLVVYAPRDSMLRMHRCEEDAIARAVADVNAPVLTSYHRERTKQPLRLAEQ